MTEHDTPPPAGDDAPAPAHHLEDLAATAAPATGVHSRRLLTEGGVAVVHVSFAPGSELAQHTAARPVLIHVLTGELDLTVAGRPIAGRPGTWLHMPAGTVHALRARGPATMILTLLPRDHEG